MRARALEAIGRTRWRPLIDRVRVAFPAPPPEVTEALVDVVSRDPVFVHALARGVTVRRWFVEVPRVAPARWEVPAIPTVGALARWLGLAVDDLAWLADPRGLERHTTTTGVRNHHYRWIPKRAGGARLLEAPKPRLKEAQRRVLHGILDAIPPHPAVHGFRRGRSALSCATPHVGAAVVLRLDLEDFFASVSPAPVLGVFRAAGYPWEVARTLAALCTNRTPRAVLAARPDGGDPASNWRQARRLATPHLPSGAPTSPAIANLCAWGLDVRLAAAAASAGATYTRYADDLAFSGDGSFRRRAPRFAALVAAIALEEGFRVNHRKTRVAGRATRQVIAGVVVNDRPAFPRDRWDAIRAMLHNCVVHGPSTQDRVGGRDFRAHVLGLVAAVQAIDPKRGGRLAELAARIDWSR
ncbi:MAG: reverse transcriptase family protein [Myxococcota bacterium]